MFNIIQKRKIWFTISSVLVIGSILVISTLGLKFGLDFTGGTLIEVETQEKLEITTVERIIYEAIPTLEEVKVQEAGNNRFLIRLAPLTEEEHKAILTGLRGETSLEELRFELVGPTLGQELKDKAITALIVAAVVIIFYIAWSFRHVSESVSSWKYGLGAIIALVHDILIVTGVFTVFSHYYSYQVDGLFVTALLVILGYSVNDTIVVYDRVRENVLIQQEKKGKKKFTFEELVEHSVNQTILRSINTSVTTLLVLFTLFFFGGESIKGFILALIIGIIIGTYSSIFLASPILVWWESRRKLK